MKKNSFEPMPCVHKKKGGTGVTCLLSSEILTTRRPDGSRGTLKRFVLDLKDQVRLDVYRVLVSLSTRHLENTSPVLEVGHPLGARFVNLSHQSCQIVGMVVRDYTHVLYLDIENLHVVRNPLHIHFFFVRRTTMTIENELILEA